MEDCIIQGEIVDGEHGITRPRIFTPPLRKLDETTSNGYSVIMFAEMVLHVHLYPWQKWLLIHALELLEDGSYRFRRIIVLVARQNGKTTLMGVLACWWLFIDSAKHPDRVPPVKFLVVGAAQTIDNAKGPYETVKTWCNPKPETEEEAELSIPDLQQLVQRISYVNGEEAITCRNKARYIVRAALNIRSKSAARAVFDELREQHNDDGWNAVSQITKAVWSSQLWGISNAGDYRSVVLKRQVDKGRKLVDEWTRNVETKAQTVKEFADGHDASFGYFEWSAPDKCELDDPDAIRQANPSVGYGPMTVQSVAADIDGMTEAAYRTEVLCQWVTADVVPYLPQKLCGRASTTRAPSRTMDAWSSPWIRALTAPPRISPQPVSERTGFRMWRSSPAATACSGCPATWPVCASGAEHHRNRRADQGMPRGGLRGSAHSGGMDGASDRRLQDGRVHRQLPRQDP